MTLFTPLKLLTAFLLASVLLSSTADAVEPLASTLVSVDIDTGYSAAERRIQRGLHGGKISSVI